MERLVATRKVEKLNEIAGQLSDLITRTEVSLLDHSVVLAEQPLEAFWQELDQNQKATRREFTESVTRTGADFDTLLGQLDAYRWLSRISYHLWRVVHHLQSAQIIANVDKSESQTSLES